MAQYILTSGQTKIPLPVTPPPKVFMQGGRGLFYEAGARIYHLAQRRVSGF